MSPKSELQASPSSPTEGRVAIVTDAGLDAMDAGCVRRASARRRMTQLRTAKPCGPDAPTLASSLRGYPQATVARKPGRRGEHGISRSTIVQETPECSGEPVVTTLVCFFILHARLRVHWTPGVSCALFFEGRRCKTRAIGAAGMRTCSCCLKIESEVARRSYLPSPPGGGSARIERSEMRDGMG